MSLKNDIIDDESTDSSIKTVPVIIKRHGSTLSVEISIAKIHDLTQKHPKEIYGILFNFKVSTDLAKKDQETRVYMSCDELGMHLYIGDMLNTGPNFVVSNIRHISSPKYNNVCGLTRSPFAHYIQEQKWDTVCRLIVSSIMMQLQSFVRDNVIIDIAYRKPVEYLFMKISPLETIFDVYATYLISAYILHKYNIDDVSTSECLGAINEYGKRLSIATSDTPKMEKGYSFAALSSLFIHDNMSAYVRTLGYIECRDIVRDKEDK